MKNTIFKNMVFLITLLLLTSALAIQYSYAQAKFQQRIGATNVDVARSIIQTTDTGYAVAGNTYSYGAGGSDFYIVKINSSGTLQWSKTVGGTGSDVSYSIIQTTDGGYAAAGYTDSFLAEQNSDFYIVKLDSNGSLQWSRIVGGPSSDHAQAIIQTTDGGYVVAGDSPFIGAGDYDMLMIKLDGSGTLQWSRAVGGIHYDGASSITQTTDGGYVLAGQSFSFGAGDFDFYIVKLNAGGTLQWSRTVGGPGDDEAYSIIQTADGGYAVAGNTHSFGAGNYDCYIVKLSGNGNLQWSKTVGGSGNDYANSIIQTTDGGYVVAGSTWSFGAGGEDFYIIKLDGSGTLVSSKTIGGTSIEEAYSMILTTDGGYAIAGLTDSFGAMLIDMYIVKLDASGNTCGNYSSASSISGSGGTLGSPNSIVTFPNPTVSTPTSLTGTGGTLTTVCIIGIEPISNEIPNSYELLQNYPNPFNPNTIINFQLPKSNFVTLKIYDILGHEVATLVNEQLKVGKYQVDWDASNYASGMYFYKLSTSEFSETKKMILVK